MPGTLQSSWQKISSLLTTNLQGKSTSIFVLLFRPLRNLSRVTELVTRWQKQYSNPHLPNSQVYAPKPNLTGTLLVQRNKKSNFFFQGLPTSIDLRTAQVLPHGQRVHQSCSRLAPRARTQMRPFDPRRSSQFPTDDGCVESKGRPETWSYRLSVCVPRPIPRRNLPCWSPGGDILGNN